MTRKTRRSKASGDDDATRGSGSRQARKAEPELEDAVSTADTPSGKDADAESAAPQEDAQAAKKVTLPAFGFAEDLLPKSAAKSASDKPASGSGAAETETENAESEAAEPEAEARLDALATQIDAADPRRIFAFADGLERGAAAEPEVAPVRLETWVAFSLAGEVFALPVAPIREVVRVMSITRVPHAPRPIRGVTNRRGRVIPVIDLRLRIELPSAELGRASRVIVVSSRRRLLGLLVDAVHQVIHIDLERVQPPPDDVMTVQSDYLSGVYHLDDQLILLLDIDRALIIQDAAPETVGNTSEPEAVSDAPA